MTIIVPNNLGKVTPRDKISSSDNARYSIYIRQYRQTFKQQECKSCQKPTAFSVTNL